MAINIELATSECLRQCEQSARPYQAIEVYCMRLRRIDGWRTEDVDQVQRRSLQAAVAQRRLELRPD